MAPEGPAAPSPATAQRISVPSRPARPPKPATAKPTVIVDPAGPKTLPKGQPVAPTAQARPAFQPRPAAPVVARTSDGQAAQPEVPPVRPYATVQLAGGFRLPLRPEGAPLRHVASPAEQVEAGAAARPAHNLRPTMRPPTSTPANVSTAAPAARGAAVPGGTRPAVPPSRPSSGPTPRAGSLRPVAAASIPNVEPRTPSANGPDDVPSSVAAARQMFQQPMGVNGQQVRPPAPRPRPGPAPMPPAKLAAPVDNASKANGPASPTKVASWRLPAVPPRPPAN